MPIARWHALLEIAAVFTAAALVMWAGYAAFVTLGGAVVVSILLRRQPGGVGAAGLIRRRLSWRTAGSGVGLGVGLVAFAGLLAWPFAEWITGTNLDVSHLEAMIATPASFAAMLAASWIVAGFGEEWFFRAYPMTRCRDLSIVWRAGVAVLVIAVFGFGHQYQGPAGMVLSSIMGTTLLIAYLATGRSLWITVIAHGTVDTCAFVLLRAGLLQ